MASKGIDISTYNTVNDWNALAKAVDFVILKVIRADGNPDNKFVSHLNGCRKHNIYVQGVYNYSYATSTQKARQDAKNVISVLKANNLFAGVWLDVEDVSLKGLGAALVEIIRAYKLEIESAGYPFGIYTGLYFYNTYLKPYQDRLNDIPMWIARYPSTSPTKIEANTISTYKPTVPNMVAWQYSSKGQVPGIAGNVDLNEMYVQLPGTGAPTPTPQPVVITSNYYPKYTGTTTSIITALSKVGEPDTSYTHRSKIAKANGIKLYIGSANQNIAMVNLLKQGKLMKA